jgi:O-antigen ligase
MKSRAASLQAAIAGCRSNFRRRQELRQDAEQCWSAAGIKQGRQRWIAVHYGEHMRPVAEYHSAPSYLAPPEEVDTGGRFDGWYAAFLLFMLVFGPSTAPGESLPPIRSSDAVILILLLSRWLKSSRLGGGFLFSRRVRVFSIPMLWISAVLVLATVLQIGTGDSSFFIKDFFTPVALVRMAFIAAIMASFDFNERHIQQFCKGFVLVALLSIALAMVQRYYPHTLAGFVEQYYATALRSLEIKSKGTQTRVVGTLGNANVFAGYLVMMAAGCLAIVIFSKRLIRLVALAAYLGLAGAVVLATASRTGIISLTIVTGAELLLSMQGRARWSAMVIIVMLTPVFLTVREQAYSLPLNPRTQALIAGKEGAVGDGIQSRFRLWTRSWEEAKSSILFGVGSRKASYQITDNGYLYTLLKCGLLGLIPYVMMLILLLLRGVRAYFAERDRAYRLSIAFGTAIVLSHAIFEFTGDFFWNIGYGAFVAALIGMLCGATRRRGREVNSVPSQDAVGWAS